MRLEVALAAQDELGEGPWWSVADQALWRVDILGRQLHRWEPQSDESASWALDEPIGFAVPAGQDRVVAGVGSRFVVFDLGTESQDTLSRVEPQRTDIRLNDGKADRQGRVWAGTMTDDESPTGALYRLEPDGEVFCAVGGIGVSNGLGWSPDNEIMYYTDSAARTIWAFDYDATSATMSHRRVFATDEDCYPDGLTVDAEGGVWSAKWDGFRVVRYDPGGTITAEIDSLVARPTSCMFGGPDLDVLYVTSARVGLDQEQLVASPAGAVLAAEPGVRGIPEVEARLGVNR